MNIGPSSRYMFLFDKPITYTRPLIFGEKRITDVKLLVIGYNDDFYVSITEFPNFLKEFGLL